MWPTMCRRLFPLVALAAMLLASGLVVPSTGAAAADPTLTCVKKARSGLKSCLRSMGAAVRKCYQDTGAPCLTTDKRAVNALAKLDKRLRKGCPTDTVVQGAGFGPLMTVDALVERLSEDCAGEVASVAARSFGGPHGAVLATASDNDEKCLLSAFRTATNFLAKTYNRQGSCIEKALKGKTCDTTALTIKIAAQQQSQVDKVDRKCTDLSGLIGMDASDYIDRAVGQSRCAAGATYSDPAPLTFDCGPANPLLGVTVVKTEPTGLTPLAPGVWTQLALDKNVWGSLCGDGSDFAMWVQRPTDPADLENLIFYMSGGGFCSGTQCLGVAPGSFEGLSDVPPTAGILSADPAETPFADWAKVFVPYCNQDVYTGGGVSDVIDASLTVERYGALNVRAALRVARNILWAELDAVSANGYRPDLMNVVFTGNSAGGVGTAYNYHVPLDEMRWVNTVAIAGAGMTLDNGLPLGVNAIGALAQALWNTKPYQAPYCLESDCADGGKISAAHSARLLATPMQQLIRVTNQGDTTQRSTTLFPSQTDFINAVRTSYCMNQGLPGLHYFLSSDPTSKHGILLGSFDNVTVDGVGLSEWTGNAAFDPTSLTDKVSEGDLVTEFPGVAPFGCSVSP